MPACHKCGRQLNATVDFGRQDTCEGCRSATHVCLNCLHYDTSRYNECAETVADRVVDKEKANFCDHFKPSEARKTPSGLSASEQARKAAEALFKKGK
ncbi:MAG: hypothetical protein HY074_10870 [Deltaproteobacteria bacterium]|nr:hypothetical protein [Deltaproteobacteria bacterium]